MALPPLRSMNGELNEGMTDGSHKKVTRNRGGFVEQTTPETRRAIDDRYLNITEAYDATMPDGTTRYATGTRADYSRMRHQG
ncbi:hypothetical protein ACFYP4_02885 [Streptomyces sp. NPDC005551]|uniref:hypothetical protein n=1 Tax=Streptomyces sp. NPDC005551 TaxID=3364725 RepID=UPI0036D06675